jgi:hypothetical protein
MNKLLCLSFFGLLFTPAAFAQDWEVSPDEVMCTTPHDENSPMDVTIAVGRATQVAEVQVQNNNSKTTDSESYKVTKQESRDLKHRTYTADGFMLSIQLNGTTNPGTAEISIHGTEMVLDNLQCEISDFVPEPH